MSLSFGSLHLFELGDPLESLLLWFFTFIHRHAYNYTRNVSFMANEILTNPKSSSLLKFKKSHSFVFLIKFENDIVQIVSSTNW